MNKRFVSVSAIQKLCITLVTAIILVGCDLSSQNLGQDAPLTVSEVDRQSLLVLLAPLIGSKSAELYSLEVDLSIPGGNGKIIELVVDELSLEDVVSTLGYLPASQVTSFNSVQEQGLGDLNGVSEPRKLKITAGSHKIEGLKVQTYYRFKARACYEKVSAGSCSKESAPLLARTLGLPLGQVSLTDLTASSQKVDIEWSYASGTDFYQVQRKAAGENNWSPLGEKISKTRSYTDSSVIAEATYEYRVTACQYQAGSLSNTQCSTSNAKTVTILKSYRSASFPASNVKTTPHIKSIDIVLTSLKKPKEVPVYFLQRLGIDNNYITISRINEADVTPQATYVIQDEGRNSDTTYYYQVRACSAKDPDNCYKWYGFNAKTLTPPSAGILTGEVIDYSSNLLEWPAVDNAETYVVQRRKGAGDYEEVAKVAAEDPTPDPYRYTDANLDPNSPYSYKVLSCISDAGELVCTDSEELGLTTDVKLGDRESVRNLAIASLAIEPQLTVSWNEYSPKPDYYKVSVRETTVLNWTVLAASHKQTSYIHRNLNEKTKYEYKVVACIRSDDNCTPDVTETGTTVQPFNRAIEIEAELLLGEGTIAKVSWATVAGITKQYLLARRRVVGETDSTVVTFDYVSSGLTEKTVVLEPNYQYQFYLNLCGDLGACADTTTSSGWITTREPINTAIEYVDLDGENTYASHKDIQVSWKHTGIEPRFYLYSRENGDPGYVTDVKKIEHVATVDKLLESIGLTAETAYTYKIRPCITDNQCSSVWYPITIITDKELGDSPNLRSVKSHSFDVVQLAYTIPEGATYYQIYRKKGGGSTDFTAIGVKQNNPGTAEQTEKDDTVEAGASYEYKIKACRNHENNCRTSQPTTVSVPYKLAGSEPTGFSAAPAIDGVGLSWVYTDPNKQSPIFYQVANKAKPDGEYDLVKPKLEVPNTTIDGLLADTAYGAKVRACLQVPEGAKENCSQWTELSYGTKAIADATPTATLSETDARLISVSWSTPTELPTGGTYQLSRESAATGNPLSGTPTLIETLSLDVTGYEDNSLSYSTDYRYTLKICADAKAINCGPSKSSDSVSTGSNVNAGTLTVSVKPGVNDAVLALTGATGNQGYKVEITDKDGAPVVTENPTTNPYTVSGLDGAKSPYTAKVSVCDFASCGESVSKSFDLKLGSAPDLQSVKSHSFDVVRLAYTIPEGATYYQIYRKKSGSTNFTAIEGKQNNPGTAEQTKEDDTVEAGASYEYKIEACRNQENNCRTSRTTTVNVPYKLAGSQPTGFSAAPEIDGVGLNWAYYNRYNQSPIFFQVENKKNPDGKYDLVKSELDFPNTEIDGLLADTAYGARVRACLQVPAGAEKNCSDWTLREYTTKAIDDTKPTATLSEADVRSISVSWIAPAELPTGGTYQLSRLSATTGNPLSGTPAIVANFPLTSTSYEDNGLSYSTDYRYTLKVCADAKAINCSSGQSSVTVSTGSNVNAGTLTVSVKPGVNDAVLALTGATGNQRYKVEITDKDGAPVVTANPTTSPYTVSGLDGAKSPYTAKVSICDFADCGESVSKSFDLKQLVSAADLRSVKSHSFNVVRLTYTIPEKATYYQIYRNKSGGTNLTAIGSKQDNPGIAEQTQEDRSVEAGASYEYKIKACRDQENNCLTSRILAVNVPYKLAGSEPTGFSAAPAIDGVGLSWVYTDPNKQSPIFFQVANKAKADGEYDLVKPKLEVPNTTIDGLLADTAYGAKVRACLQVPEGAKENCSQWTELSYGTKAIADTTPTASLSKADARSISVSWSTPAELPTGGKYKLSRESAATGTPLSGTPALIETLSLGITGYEDNSLSYSTDYRYTLKICADAEATNCGPSKPSVIVSTGSNVNAGTASVDGVLLGADKAVLSFAGATGSQAYKVEIKDKYGTPVVTGNQVTSPYTVPNLDGAKSPYTAKVSICDFANCGESVSKSFSPLYWPIDLKVSIDFDSNDEHPEAFVLTSSNPSMGGSYRTILSSASSSVWLKQVGSNNKRWSIPSDYNPDFNPYTLVVTLCNPSDASNCLPVAQRKSFPSQALIPNIKGFSLSYKPGDNRFIRGHVTPVSGWVAGQDSVERYGKNSVKMWLDAYVVDKSAIFKSIGDTVEGLLLISINGKPLTLGLEDKMDWGLLNGWIAWSTASPVFDVTKAAFVLPAGKKLFTTAKYCVLAYCSRPAFSEIGSNLLDLGSVPSDLKASIDFDSNDEHPEAFVLTGSNPPAGSYYRTILRDRGGKDVWLEQVGSNNKRWSVPSNYNPESDALIAGGNSYTLVVTLCNISDASNCLPVAQRKSFPNQVLMPNLKGFSLYHSLVEGTSVSAKITPISNWWNGSFVGVKLVLKKYIADKYATFESLSEKDRFGVDVHNVWSSAGSAILISNIPIPSGKRMFVSASYCTVLYHCSPEVVKHIDDKPDIYSPPTAFGTASFVMPDDMSVKVDYDRYDEHPEALVISGSNPPAGSAFQTVLIDKNGKNIWLKQVGLNNKRWSIPSDYDPESNPYNFIVTLCSLSGASNCLSQARSQALPYQILLPKIRNLSLHYLSSHFAVIGELDLVSGWVPEDGVGMHINLQVRMAYKVYLVDSGVPFASVTERDLIPNGRVFPTFRKVRIDGKDEIAMDWDKNYKPFPPWVHASGVHTVSFYTPPAGKRMFVSAAYCFTIAYCSPPVVRYIDSPLSGYSSLFVPGSGDINVGGLAPTVLTQIVRNITVNDTGVTWKGLAPTGGVIPVSGSICNDDGSVSGQDCGTGRDAEANAGILIKQGAGVAGFDFTKLDEDGNDLLATATVWSCVRDNVTGLVWEGKTSDDGLYSGQWKYSWYDLDSNAESIGVLGASPDGSNCGTGSEAPSSCDTYNYIEKVNKQGFCGVSNWQLPQTEELRSIALIGSTSASVDADFFPNAAVGEYWTSSLLSSENVKSVSFALNGSAGISKFTDLPEMSYIRLVSKPNVAEDDSVTDDSVTDVVLQNFEFLDEGANVKHLSSGLIWSRCLAGTTLDNGGTPQDYRDDSCIGTGQAVNWQTALQIGDDEKGWRVPNVKELGSILSSPSLENGVLDIKVFPVVSEVNALDSLILWTTTPAPLQPIDESAEPEKDSTSSWALSSRYGIELQNLRTKQNRVLLVR